MTDFKLVPFLLWLFCVLWSLILAGVWEPLIKKLIIKKNKKLKSIEKNSLDFYGTSQLISDTDNSTVNIPEANQRIHGWNTVNKGKHRQEK